MPRASQLSRLRPRASRVPGRRAIVLFGLALATAACGPAALEPPAPIVAVEPPAALEKVAQPEAVAARLEPPAVAEHAVPPAPADSSAPVPAPPAEPASVARPAEPRAESGPPEREASASSVPEACQRPPQPSAAPGQDAQTRWRGFRDPLPPAALWDPPGQRRVGLQAGHWQVEQAPAELRNLGHGAIGGGKQEWELNLDLARRARVILEEAGIAVDILPATVPPGYRAHAFVSIHADGDESGRLRGFKIARPGFSSVPEADDRLVDALNVAYAASTALPREDTQITLRMRYYYAFNSRRYCHAVAPGVPQVIVETGFLTSAADRALLLGDPDAAARGIANGVLAFLKGGAGQATRP